MGYDFVIDTEKTAWGSSYEEIEIDKEAKPRVSILFEKEGVVLYADCHGSAVFHNLNGDEIHRGKAESTTYFSRVHVRVEKKGIFAEFPITKWVDHYPHCDGEYDRWSEITLDTIVICCPLQ